MFVNLWALRAYFRPTGDRRGKWPKNGENGPKTPFFGLGLAIFPRFPWWGQNPGGVCSRSTVCDFRGVSSPPSAYGNREFPYVSVYCFSCRYLAQLGL